MEEANGQDHRPRGPRLYHKKSRTGCLRCKQRRVKCDEVRPSCSSCSRHGVDCVYPNQVALPVNGQAAGAHRAESKPSFRATVDTASAGPAAATVATTASYRQNGKTLSPRPAESNPAHSPHSSTFYPSPGSSHPTPLDDGTDSDMDLPEGSWRRFWELRLLHNQHTRMIQPFNTPPSPEVVRMWAIDVPNLAMSMAQQQNRCSLLYIMFAHSALNMWTTSTDKQERDELMKLQQIYQLLCSKEQRRDIDELHLGNPRNADYICFSSLKILSHSLALVQTLSVDPWEPPTQWLHMGHGAGEIFEMARALLDPNVDSYIKTFATSHPIIQDPGDTILSDHSPLGWLLDHPTGPGSLEAQADRELDDGDVRSVYEKAMAYTCSVKRAVDRAEPQYAVMRRLGGFAVYVPSEFARFIEERRPRAMVILAHFMALWLDHEDIWILGRSGELQIRAIHKNLPLEWRCKLDGLLERFKQEPS